MSSLFYLAHNSVLNKPYTVWQELTKCCRSVIFQKQTHSKRDQICGYQKQECREEELEEGKQKEQTSS